MSVLMDYSRLPLKRPMGLRDDLFGGPPSDSSLHAPGGSAPNYKSPRADTYHLQVLL